MIHKIFVASGVLALYWIAWDTAYSYVDAFNECRDKQDEIVQPLNHYRADARQSLDSDGFKWVAEKGLTYTDAAQEALTALDLHQKYAERDAYLVKVLAQYDDAYKWEILSWDKSPYDPLWKFANGDTPKRSDDPTGLKYSVNSLPRDQVENLNRCYAHLKNRYQVESPTFGQLTDLRNKTRSPECEL